MKKIILLFGFILSLASAFGQPIITRSSSSVTVQDARVKDLYNMVLPTYNDTTDNPGGANYQNNIGIDSCGALIYTYTNASVWVRQCLDGSKRWGLVGSFNGRDTVYVEFPLGVRWDSTGHQVIFLRQNGLMDGGVITLDSCMRINVTAPTYNINYQQYLGVPTTLTIEPSDGSLNRIDRIVADTFGLVYVIKGTPATLGIPPPFNPSFQIVLGEIPVEAGITCLNIGVKTVWDEDLGTPDEWDLTTEGAIAADPDNTDNPYHLTKAIFVESYVDSTQLIFTHTSEVDTVTSTSVLKAYLYLNGLFDNAIQVQYFLDTVPVSNNLVINPFFNVLDSNNYMNVSIPFNEWNFFGGAYYNKVVVTLRGWDSSGAKGFYLDWITIQNGISQSAGQKVYVDSVKTSGDSLFYYKNGIAFYGGTAGGGGGAGTVTIVTGTSPIIITSTPTTTPNVTIQPASTSQGGYLTQADWNGFDSAIVEQYVTPDSLYLVSRHRNGQLDSTSYVSGHPFLTLTTTGTSGAATLDVPNQILNIPVYNSGTVTSVNMTVPSLLAVSGNPITTSGTLAVTWNGTAQGDLPYFSGTNTATVLNKSTTAGHVLTNAGTNNNPVWGAPFTLTTTGTSGAATFSGGTLNIPQYSSGGGGGINIYNSDSSLAADRTVTLNSHTLTFSGNAPTATGVLTGAVIINPAMPGHANNDTLAALWVRGTYSGAFSFMRKIGIYSDSDIVVNNFRIGHGLKGHKTNLVFGIGSLDSSSAGGNIAIGTTTMPKNILGTNNIAIGNSAYATGTGGNNNVVLGVSAVGTGIATGSDNVAVGYQSLKALTSGANNVALGKDALLALSTSAGNTAIGWSAGAAISTGTGRNVAVGFAAGSQTTTGTDNVSVGYNARGNGGGGTASRNTAIGYTALNTSTGDANIGLGYLAGAYNTSGASQIFIGSLDRSTYVREQTETPIYIQQNTTPNSQTGTHNFKTGIFNWSPTAYLHLPAGSTVAGSAPLKITYTSLATTAATGNGTTATLTFTAQTIPPFIVGSTIVVSGVTPAGYNATAVVTAATTTTVSYGNTTTGAQTVAGTIIQGQLLTTPEPGAIEFDGTHFYGTNAAGTRIQLDN